MEENLNDSKTSVSPKNNFWVWIVVALSATVSSIAIWGDSQKDKLISNYKDDIKIDKRVITIKDSIINHRDLEIDTLRRSLYIAQSVSIDKFIEYDSKIKELNNKTNKNNSELIKVNQQKQKNINSLTKLKNEIKN